jgi:hypothetical protein
VQISTQRAKLLGVAVGVAIVVGVVAYLRLGARGERSSVDPTTQPTAVARPPNAGVAANTNSPPLDLAGAPPGAGSDGGSGRYPVDLDALRAELPGNRYWAEGAPTSDPEVAKARAARAERANTELGRIQANEATPDQIRAYYADRRGLSRDYVELSERALAHFGAALPERDRGMFELSANLHRARLHQIDRDEADALARRGAK